MNLRPYQQQAVDKATAVVNAGIQRREATRLLIASPTGTGKSYMLIALREWLDEQRLRHLLVSPRVEILEGIAAKAGLELPAQTSMRRQALEDAGLYTPVALRNRLLSGDESPADVLLVDEAHHSAAETYELLTLLHGPVPVIGVTGTPYRGTPKGTAHLREIWGEPYIALTWRQAIAQGYACMPHVEVVPLIDDDTIRVVNGELAAAGVQRAVESRLDDLADLCCDTWIDDPRPAMVAVHSTKAAKAVAEAISYRGVPAEVIIQSTRPAERTRILEAVSKHEALLVQIAVVGEGVDMPALRILVDARPTLSPVAWVQLVGRITRPGDTPRVLVCCRNVERHAYLLEGLLPPERLKQCTEAFGEPSQRSGRRVGLEALGRHKPVPLPLLDGTKATCHPLYTWDPDNGRSMEYVIIVMPGTNDYVCARRHNARGLRGTVYGRWEGCDLPDDLTGWRTSQWLEDCTESQLRRWQKDAEAVGLDPSIKPSGRQIGALFALRHLRGWYW